MFPCWCYTIFTILHISCATVVSDDFRQCSEFFYKGQPPTGFSTFGIVQEFKQICQSYNNDDFYATLYSSADKTPIYSAYRLDDFYCPPGQPNRMSKWFIEPQLSDITKPNMDSDVILSSNFEVKQAINIDYPNTNFDRGHLNPSFYQCYKARSATFTLTNAVPQDPCFNQQIWKKMEVKSKEIMKRDCSFPGARRYFVTGAVPTKFKIPQPYHDAESDRKRVYNRVSVPSGMWTAACCDSSWSRFADDRDKGFSFAYFGRNEPDSLVFPNSVFALQQHLKTEYKEVFLDIFVDHCFNYTVKSQKAIKELSIPIEQKIVENILKISKSSESSVTPMKMNYIKNINNIVSNNEYTTTKDWKFTDFEFSIMSERSDIQNIRNLLSSQSLTTVLRSTGKVSGKHSNIRGDVHTLGMESNKIDTILNMKMVSTSAYISDIKNDLYTVVPTNPRTLSATLDQCRHDHPCDYYGKSYQWCYTDWSKNWDYCCVKDCGRKSDTKYEWCYTAADDSQWAYCSQRSSVKTVTGKRCRDDHECGTHGQSYYWCYTDKENNWDYCCQPWHECNYHGWKNTWCYVDQNEKKKWQYCTV